MKHRRGKRVGKIRKVLAGNVTALMKQRYAEHPNQPRALAKEAKISLSSVQRTTEARTGASVDTIEAIAAVFGVQPFQLLIPRGSRA